MSDALLWNEIGNLYIQVGSQQEAIAAIKRAIELDPVSASFQCNLGQAYYRAGEFGNALTMYRKSIQLMPAPKDQAVVWNKIGDTCRAMGDLESAMKAYKKADDLNLGVSSPEPRKVAAGEHPINAVKENEEKTDPGPIELLSGLRKLVTRMEHSLGDQPPAESSPSNQETIGQETANPQDFLEADTQPTRAIRSKRELESPISSRFVEPVIASPTPGLPASVNVDPVKKTLYVYPDPGSAPEEENKKHLNSGMVEKNRLTTVGYPDIPNLQEILAKLRVYENITRTNPTNDRAWDTLGKLYKSMGRFKDAISAYLKAIEIAPTRDIYYYYLGLLYSVEQQHELAVEAFQAVLQRNPDYVLAHGALAGVFHRMGQENKANHHIAIALPLMENESAYNQACFYAICGDNERALEFLQSALKSQDTTIEWIKSDPDLEPVRTDPRYLELISDIQGADEKTSDENYYSSARKSKENRLLPHLNSSLAR